MVKEATAGGLREDGKSKYTVLGVLFATWTYFLAGRMVTPLAMPSIAAEFGLSPLAMGGVLSAFSVGYVITQIPGGLLADRFGIRVISTVSLLLRLILSVAMSFVGNAFQLAILWGLAGLCEGLFPGCSLKAISVWFPQKERATAAAIMLSSNSVGPAIASLCGATVILWGGWRTLYVGLSLPGLVLLVLCWRYLGGNPQVDDAARISSPTLTTVNQSTSGLFSGFRSVFRTLFREFSVWRYCLVVFFFDITLWGFIHWLPTYLVKARGFKTIQMGMIATLPFAFAAIARAAGGWISDHYFARRRQIPVVVAQLCSSCFLYLTLTSKSSSSLIIFQTLAGVSIQGFMSVFWAIPMSAIPRTVMGTASGVINSAAQVAAFVSPLLVGYLMKSAGGHFGTAFALLMTCPILSCILLLALAPGRSTSLAGPPLLMELVQNLRGGAEWE